VSVTWDLRPDSILSAKFRQVTAKEQNSFRHHGLPGSTPQQMTVLKNDSVPHAEPGGVSLPSAKRHHSGSP